MEYTMSQYANKNDLIADMRADLAAARAENERLRDAFKNPDREVLRVVCYGTVCYADEFEEILERYWEALK